MTASAAATRDLLRLLGQGGVLHSSPDTEQYERGYRYGSGRALAVARPSTVVELASVVRYCFAHEVRIVPQGANTGLVGASTPDESGAQRVLSLDRLRGVEALDLHNRTATVRAGTRLSELNSAAAQHDLFYPIDGPHNIAYYKRYTPPAERAFAGHLKRLCDPKGILGTVDFS